MVPEERLREHHLERANPLSLKELIRRGILQLGGAKWLAADYFVLARSGTTLGEARTLCESLAELADDRPPVMMALSDARVAVVGSDRFIKFPLSLDQQAKLVGEVENTLEARKTAFRPHVVPSGTVGYWDRSIPYSTFPRIDASSAPRVAAEPAILEILGRLNADVLAPINSTTFWQRLDSERGRTDARDLDASPLRDAVLDALSGAVVPVGPTHGDLHAANLLMTQGGESFLVDWNRFEQFNPLILDATYAALVAHQAATGASLAESLGRFVDDAIEGPLARRASRLFGDLLPVHAATITLLDRVVSYSRPRRFYKPWTMPPFREASLALVDRRADW